MDSGLPARAANHLAFAAAAIYVASSRDMQSIRKRRSAESQIIPTRHGLVEFKTRGSGPAVLVVHGTGGGFDQGIAIAQAFGGDGVRWVAPSRFGYLRALLPADASTAYQADAFIVLLSSAPYTPRTADTRQLPITGALPVGSSLSDSSEGSPDLRCKAKLARYVNAPEMAFVNGMVNTYEAAAINPG